MPQVIIADDSLFIRKVVKKYLEEIGFDVVAEVRNGIDAIKKVEILKPELIVLDLLMPLMDGVTALKKIMQSVPTRALIISAFAEDVPDLVFNAFESGALAFVSKEANYHQNLTTNKNLTFDFKKELQQKALNCLKAKIVRNNLFSTSKQQNPKTIRSKVLISKLKRSKMKNKLVIIGASTGGPTVVKEVISRIKIPFPPIIIIQHLPIGFTEPFSIRLNKINPDITVLEAENNMALKENMAYVAPSGQHLVVKRNSTIHLYSGDRVNGVIPSIDPLVISASNYYGNKLTLVILTGMGADGLAGARFCKQKGANIVAQDEKTSTVYGMPKEIVEAKLANFVSNPMRIGMYLNKQLGV